MTEKKHSVLKKVKDEKDLKVRKGEYDESFNVDDIVVHADGRKGRVASLDEKTITVEWDNGDNLVEDTVDLGSKLEFTLETAAMDSLHPNTHPVSAKKSRVEYLNHMIGAMAAMQTHELEKLYYDSVAQIGHEADKVPSSAEHNRDSIKAKPSKAEGKGGPVPQMPMPKLQKEDMDELFGEAELTEEFKEKASVLFEAALNSRITLEVTRLEESYWDAYEKSLHEAIDEINQELTENLESYFDYVAERWLAENQLAVESALRNDLVSDFIDGLKNLFSEHYMSVPEDKVNVLEEVMAENDTLVKKLDDAIHETIELKKVIDEKTKNEVVESLSVGLTATQKEKFKALVEGLEFDNEESFAKKVEIVKEAHFVSKKVVESNIMTESFEGEVETKILSPSITAYADAITRSVKK